MHLSVIGSSEQIPVQSPKASTHAVGWTVQSPLDGSQQTMEGCGAGVIIGITVACVAVVAVTGEVG